jgi:hypothetical protein
MSCCGKTSSGTVQAVSANARMHSSQTGAYSAGVTFEYIGDTGLTAIGAITRRTYHFPERGSRVAADRRDFASLLQVPTLRHVR